MPHFKGARLVTTVATKDKTVYSHKKKYELVVCSMLTSVIYFLNNNFASVPQAKLNTSFPIHFFVWKFLKFLSVLQKLPWATV